MRSTLSSVLVLAVVGGCFRSVAVDASTERDGSADVVVTDAIVGSDGGARASCVAPDTFTFDCGDAVATPWAGMTPAGPLMVVESLEQAEASGITDCPTDIRIHWSVSDGGLGPKGAIDLLIVAADAYFGATIDARDACTLVYTAPGTTTSITTSCTFSGCFVGQTTDHAAGLVGTVIAERDGFAIDVPIAVPLCSVLFCL